MQHDSGLSTASPVSPSAPPDSYDFSPSSTSRAGRKRKANPASSRGVASLTPDQLAKKRANDREAQRAIRERTKHTIENLERRIQDLISQQPYQELQEVIRQKDAIQAENEEIRRRLASVMSLIQPIIGAQGLTDLATAAQHNPHSTFTTTSGALVDQPYLPAQSNDRAAFSISPNISQDQLESSAYQPAYGAEETEEYRNWTSSKDALDHQRDNLHRSIELNENGERVNFSFLLDSLGQRSSNGNAETQHSQQQTSPSVRRPTYPALANSREQSQLPPAPWSVLPKLGPPTCPLDRLLLNFLRTRQGDVMSADSSTNPLSYPSVSSLLNPGHTPLDPLSQLMIDIISKFPHVSELPNQVATLFTMFSVMRWQIHPTQENYERLPEYLRPTPAQLYTIHPAWIDHLVFPQMRDKVIANSQDYPFDNWFLAYTSGMSVNWPYDPVDCLLSTSEQDEPVMNPVFELHVRRIENWSLGPLFAETFPELVETTRIKARAPGGTTRSPQNAERSRGMSATNT